LSFLKNSTERVNNRLNLTLTGNKHTLYLAVFYIKITKFNFIQKKFIFFIDNPAFFNINCRPAYGWHGNKPK